MDNSVKDILGNGGLLSKVIPNYEQRDGQIKVAEAIYDSYGSHKTVLVNAPTGNGKSMASLVPAILNKDCGKTVISTATKALQSQYGDKDIPMLHQIFKFKSHVLKGRENYVCLYKYDRNSVPIDIADEFGEWIDGTSDGDLETFGMQLSYKVKHEVCSNSDDCLEEECPFRNDCFYFDSKQKAMEADVLVVNHDLLSLFLLLREKRVNIFGDVYSVIIDEAHKLEDIMTKYMGFTLNVNSCNTFVKNILKYADICCLGNHLSEDRLNGISSLCDQISGNMNRLFESFLSDDDESYRIFSSSLNIRLCEKIMENITVVFSRLPQANEFFSSQKKVMSLYENIMKRFNTLYSTFRMLVDIDKNISEYCYYTDSCDDIFSIKLNILPIDISPRLNKMLFERKHDLEDGDFGCVSLLSATLCINKSFEFVKRRLGISANYMDSYMSDNSCLTEVSVKEIFDYKHSCLLYVPKGIMEPSNNGDRQVFTEQIVSTIKSIDEIVDGGILALFTSYGEMNRVFDSVENKTDRNVLNQMLLSRQKAIAEFKKDESSVFFGTKTFWEGVDIQGKACSCVVIDRIPFPVPNEPIIEARIDKIKQYGGNWFDDFYLPMAIIALQQGFGRLIRTNKDLGMVVLMDVRIITKQYGYKIMRSLPDCLVTRDVNKVKLFWDVVRKKRKLRSLVDG